MNVFHYRNLLLAAVCWACVILLVGCAVGRNDANGDIVLGFKAGRLVETANQAIAAGSEGLLGMLGVAAGPAGAVGLIAAKFWKDAEAAKSKRDGENKGWDEGQRAMLTQYGSGIVPPTLPPTPGAGGAT